MPLFFLPEFIADLQAHNDPNFAKRVLLKTVSSSGDFLLSPNDHRYHNINGAWIRYISRKRTAYRVVYIREGEDIYLYRAGEHSVVEHLSPPRTISRTQSLSVSTTQILDTTTQATSLEHNSSQDSNYLFKKNFLRNSPNPQIFQTILSRRNLPHRDIWLVSPYITTELFSPTKLLGKLLVDQVEDGSRVTIFTLLPQKLNTRWMDILAERGVDFFICPNLHTKLFCFLLDENRRYEIDSRERHRYNSLYIIGSANLTTSGLAANGNCINEELCYSVPTGCSDFIEGYVAELMICGYDLTEVHSKMARGLSDQLRKARW